MYLFSKLFSESMLMSLSKFISLLPISVKVLSSPEGLSENLVSGNACTSFEFLASSVSPKVSDSVSSSIFVFSSIFVLSEIKSEQKTLY